jgi:hypothetical protein
MAFNQQESVLAVFVDFSGAYDCIWRAKLIEELKNMNIEGNMLTWISRVLDQRYGNTDIRKYGETFSNYKQTKVGLRQGAVTSTTLLNVYINDLPNTVTNNKINIGMYADDVVIWTSTKNNAKQHKTLEQTINNALKSLSKWATENKVEINTPKAVYQVFSMRLKNTNFDLKSKSETTKKREHKIPRHTHGQQTFLEESCRTHDKQSKSKTGTYKTTHRSHMEKYTGNNEHHIQNIH